MADSIRKSTEVKKPTLTKSENIELRLAKGLTHPHARIKPRRGDKDVLADLGLLALLPDIAPEADRPRRPAEGKRGGGQSAEHMRRIGMLTRHRQPKPANERPRAHILRLMEPGRTYVVNDIIRACPQLSRDAVKAYMRQRLLQLGLVERVPAPAGMPHRGPMDHGSPQKDAIRWLYRLTEAGAEEAAAIAACDRSGGD